jgi:hypothetical protein
VVAEYMGRLRVDSPPIEIGQRLDAELHPVAELGRRDEVGLGVGVEVIGPAPVRSVRVKSTVTWPTPVAVMKLESPSFLVQFGHLAGRMPSARLEIAGGNGQPFGDIAYSAMRDTDVASKELPLTDLRGEPRVFVAEAFFNQHNLFVMLTERRAARFGRGVQMQTG